jgi:SulP family sulfate permease
MILFPLGEPLFEKTGPDGIAMFYVSCIVSQVTYSIGGSSFKGGVGSEMVADSNREIALTKIDRSRAFYA